MIGATLGISDYLTRVCDEIGRLDPEPDREIERLVEAAYDEGRFVFICGNGGSGANASHLCEDLAKCTLRDFEGQKRLKVLSLTDNTAGIMAWANDEGYDRIFVEQLKNLASPGDLLLAISGSGNSPNILKAVSWANDHGLTTVGITGFSGGKAQGARPLQSPRSDRRHGGRRIVARRSFSTGSSTTCTAGSRRSRPFATAFGPADHMADPWLLGIEIGGTKLQLGIGQGLGSLRALERIRVEPSGGAEGILGQIQSALPALLQAPISLSAKSRRSGSVSAGPSTPPGAGRLPLIRSQGGTSSPSRAGFAIISVSPRLSWRTTRTPPAWRKHDLVPDWAIRRSFTRISAAGSAEH